MIYRLVLLGVLFSMLSLVDRYVAHSEVRPRHPRAQGCTPAPTAEPAPHEALAPGTSIIDVSAQADPGSVPGLVMLSLGEHVRSVNDEPADDDRNAWDRIAVGAIKLHHGPGYIDVAIAGPGSERRVLILVH